MITKKKREERKGGLLPDRIKLTVNQQLMHALNILNFYHLKGVRWSAMEVHFSDNIPFS